MIKTRKLILVTAVLVTAVTACTLVAVSITHGSTPATHHYPQTVDTPSSTVPVETAPVASEVFTLVNTERSKAGLAPLVEDTRLDTAAAAKCADMAARNYWSHDTPDGVEPWQFIHEAGVSYLSAGENLEYGLTTSKGVVTDWMLSPGHRANLLNTGFTDVGTAVCPVHGYTSAHNLRSDNGYIVVQEFAQE